MNVTRPVQASVFNRHEYVALADYDQRRVCGTNDSFCRPDEQWFNNF